MEEKLLTGGEALQILGCAKLGKAGNMAATLKELGIPIVHQMKQGRGVRSLVRREDVEAALPRAIAARTKLQRAQAGEKPERKTRPGETMRAVIALTDAIGALEQKIDALRDDIDAWIK